MTNIEFLDQFVGNAALDPEFVGLYIAARDKSETLHRYRGYRNGDLFWPISSDTRLPLGAFIKPFIALVCAQLASEGVLDLDSSVAEYLPCGKKHGYDIKLEHLLSHTGGYFSPRNPNFLIGLSADDVVQFFSNRRHFAEPAFTYNATDIDYVIIEIILQRVLSKSLDSIVDSFFPGLFENFSADSGGNIIYGHNAVGLLDNRCVLLSDIHAPFSSIYSRRYISMLDFSRFPLILGGPLLPESICDGAFFRFVSDVISLPSSTSNTPILLNPTSCTIGLLKYGNQIALGSHAYGIHSDIRWLSDNSRSVAVTVNSSSQQLIHNALGCFFGNEPTPGERRCKIDFHFDAIPGLYFSGSRCDHFIYAEREGNAINLLLSFSESAPRRLLFEIDQDGFVDILSSGVGAASIAFSAIGDGNICLLVNGETFVKYND